MRTAEGQRCDARSNEFSSLHLCALSIAALLDAAAQDPAKQEIAVELIEFAIGPRRSLQRVGVWPIQTILKLFHEVCDVQPVCESVVYVD